MALEAYAPLIPSLPGFRPQQGQPDPDPGFIAELGASMRDNTLVAGWHLLSRETFAPDPTFDFETRAKKSEVYPLDPEAFFNVQSEAEFASLETRVAAEARDRQIISAGGKSAVLASLMTGVIDPVNLLPAGTLYRGAKLGAIVKTVVSTSLAAGAGAAVGEGVLQMDQELRTPQESAAVVLGSMILGGVLGGGTAALLRKEIKAVASDMVMGTNPRTVFQPTTNPSSIGAAVAPDSHLSMLPEVGQLAPAFGVEKVFTKLNPVGRLATQDLSPTARSLGASLDSGGLAYEGVANIGGDVETIAKQYYGLLAKAILEQKRLSKLGMVAKAGGLSKFNEEVAFALRRGAQSPIPEVADYAAWLRDNLFMPMYEEAKRVGMKHFQDLSPEHIMSYAPRFARHSMIAAEYDQFQEILLEHFQERLTDIWTKRITKTKGAMDADTRVADVLELDAEGIKSYRDNLEKEIAALPQSLPEQSRIMAERVRELREQAKGAKREEAKRLRAEAAAIMESNKEQLAEFVKTEKKLKGQFRLLEHTAKGIAGKNRRLMERITTLMEMADKSRDVLVAKLNKLARGFEDLSEEARDKAIEDAVEQLQLAKERELKVIERSGSSVEEKAAAMSRFEDADAELRALVDLDPAQAADRIMAIQSELIAQGEVLAAKRRAEVDRLAAQFRNPNEAAAEARGLRNKAQQRWFDLQKRAAQDNVTIDGDNLNVATAAKWFADTVASEYMGEGARLPFFNLASGDRGPELARMLDIDETRTWSNGRKFEDFLENDLGIMLRRYIRTLGPDIELYRKFGTTNPLAPNSPFMKKIEADIQAQRDGAREDINEKAIKYGWSEEKKAAKLEARLRSIATGRDAILRDLSGVLASVRNLRGIPQHPNGALHRMGRFMLNLNATRMMGKMVLGSMSDLAAAAVRHGPLRFIKDGLLPAISDWKALNLSLREAQIAGTALDTALHNRTTAFGDLFDEYRTGWKVERANTFLASRLGLVSGMDFWNTGIKALQANVSIAWISDAIDSVAAGKASRSQLLKLGRLGIGQPEAELLLKFMREGSSNVGGLRLPNTEDWGKEAFVRGDSYEINQALEAKRIFRAALARDIDDTIVTPGAEVPLWMTENMIGRLIGQFRRFTFSSTSKILIAGLQSARANGRTTGSVMALSAMPFFLASGALSYYLWAMTSGQKARDEMLGADEEKWLTEAILRGAPLGVLGEVPNFSEDLFGLSFDREASNFRSNPADLLGPSIGLMNDLGTALRGAASGDMSPGETMAVKRMLPYNNLPYLDFLVRPLFEGIAQ